MFKRPYSVLQICLAKAIGFRCSASSDSLSSHRWALHRIGVAFMMHRLCIHRASAYTIPPRRLLAVLSYAVLTLSTTSFNRSQPLVMLDMSTQSVVSLRSCTPHRLAAEANMEMATTPCTALQGKSTHKASEVGSMAGEGLSGAHHEEGFMERGCTNGWKLAH